MKLIELKILKEDEVYKRILNELKVKGLDKLYIKKSETIDYLDIVLSVVNFLEINKKLLKNFKTDNFENIVIIIIDEILEQININVPEEQIEKIIELLKNTLLVKKVSKYLISKFIKFNSYIKNYINKNCCTNSDDVIES